MIADRLKMLRERNGITQAEFANILGISQSALGNYERGDRVPDATIIKNICIKFNMSADYLLGLSENQNPNNTSIGERLGLSDKAIETLECLHAHSEEDNSSNNKYSLRAINLLLERERERNFFRVISDYLWREYEAVQESVNTTDDPVTEDIMKTHLLVKDKETGEKYAISFDEIRQSNLLYIQKILTAYRDEYLIKKEIEGGALWI